MAKDYTRVISEILITLKNLNDKIDRCEDNLFDIRKTLIRLEQCEKINKHKVVLEIKNRNPNGDK